MAKARSPASKSPPLYADSDPGAHSSSVASTDHSENVGHEQADDQLADVPESQDPNISGWKETADCYDHIAGKLDGWKENDDYREYFENSRGCNGMLVGYEYADNDYDDNGGIPTAVGEHRGIPGQYQSPEVRRTAAEQSYSLGSVIVRRL